MSAPTPTTFPSVRVRRSATTVERPTLCPPVEGVVSDAPPLTTTSTSLGLTSGGNGRRRRGATLSERFFSPDAYVPLEGEETEGRETRRRAGSNASLGSGAGRVPSVVIHRGRGVSVGSVPGDEHHAEQEVDLLEVLDQQVSTVAHLSNLQSAFLPSLPAFMGRKPVVDLEPPIEEEAAEGTKVAEVPSKEQADEDDDEEADPLDEHLTKLLKKQKRNEMIRQMLKGVWTFMKTPLGVFFTIYGFCVVLFGAGLVFLLIIPIPEFYKSLWVEICAQVLTALFTITSLLPLPWRLVDFYYIAVINRLGSIDAKRRKQMGLPPLRDPNDFPDPADAEFWVGPGGERLTGPRPAPTAALDPKKLKASAEQSKKSMDVGVELREMEGKVGSPVSEEGEEVVVLTDKEEEKLRDAQIKFSRSQTWFRAHTTPTHHAFKMRTALYISLLMIANSLTQLSLCGIMWGLTRFTRPAWSTATLIVLSFGAGVVAAILIWKTSEATKRKKEVTRRVWKMLKKDEAALEERRLAAVKLREETAAEEKEKKRREKGEKSVV